MSGLVPIYVGDSIRFRVTIEDESNLTGYYDLVNSTQITLAISRTTGTNLLTKIFSTLASLVGDVTDGVVELPLTAAETESISFIGRCRLQIRVIELIGSTINEYTVVDCAAETRKVNYTSP